MLPRFLVAWCGAWSSLRLQAHNGAHRSILADETSPWSCGNPKLPEGATWRSRRDGGSGSDVRDQEKSVRPHKTAPCKISVCHSLVHAMQCGNLGHEGKGSAQAFAKKQQCPLPHERPPWSKRSRLKRAALNAHSKGKRHADPTSRARSDVLKRLFAHDKLQIRRCAPPTRACLGYACFGIDDCSPRNCEGIWCCGTADLGCARFAGPDMVRPR